MRLSEPSIQREQTERPESKVLHGLPVQGPDPSPLALEVCRRHLCLFGATPSPAGGGRYDTSPGIRLQWGDREETEAGTVGAALSWFGTGESDRRGSEAVVQARCGLMELHGRDIGRPRRLGLEVASVATGILAAQGILATLIARASGSDAAWVETSVLQGGLMSINHYLAIATCEAEPAFPAAAVEAGSGPPFPTSDGQWVELEVLDPECWKAFWLGLGVEARIAGRGWAPFAARHETARCSLPVGLSAATATRTASDLGHMAAATGVSLCRLRGYPEVTTSDTAEDLRPWHIHFGSLPNLAPPAPGRAAAGGNRPLSGIRVIEVTRRIQGPLAGLLLSMLGAEVIRVEPSGGDILRMVTPLAGDTGAIFQSLNRGKQPVELDLHRRAGRDALLELISEADVLLHNWRPGRDVELSLDFDACSRANPDLVYAHAGGWGASAESCPPIATDSIVQAHAGLGEGLNPIGEAPFPSRLVVADFMGGLIACEGVLAALWLRCQSGRGCRVDTALLDAAMALQAHVLAAMSRGRERGRRNGRPVWGLLDRPIETGDGFIVVSAEDAGTFERLCQACGLAPDLATDEMVVERLRARPAGEWEQLLNRAGVASGAVCTDLARIPTDRHLAPLVEAAGGTCWVPTSPWRFSP